MMDDLLVTKRDKPFVVVMDYEKYRRLEQYISALDVKEVKNDEYLSISFDEACERVSGAVDMYRRGAMQTLTMDET